MTALCEVTDQNIRDLASIRCCVGPDGSRTEELLLTDGELT